MDFENKYQIAILIWIKIIDYIYISKWILQMFVLVG